MFSAKLLNGWRLVFSLQLLKPETAASGNGDSTSAPSAAPSTSTAPSPAPSAATVAERLRLLLSDSRYTWRKLTTIAGKLGVSGVTTVVGLVSESGGRISRNGKLVKVGSLRSVAPTAPAPAPWNSAATSNENDDDAEVAEDDDFVEGEDGDEGAGYSEYEDEAEDEDNDDESDLDDEPVESFVPDSAIVAQLRNKLQSPNYRWRKLPTLAQSVHQSESATRQYLEHIGARESRRGGLFRL